MSLYKNVKTICANRNISVRMLENSLGFPRSSICKWDTNTPSVDKVKKVADYFGVSIEYFLSEEKEVV